MQNKHTNKNQLEDYFHAAANRGSMFSRNEIEQLISTDKIVKTSKTKNKTYIIKILTIMTLITVSIIAALLWNINPSGQKINEKETVAILEKNKTENTSSFNSNEIEISKPESKKSETFIPNSDVKINSVLEKDFNQKKNEKTINDIRITDKKEHVQINADRNNAENKKLSSAISSSELQKTKSEKNNDNKQIKLEGIHMIELSRDELLQLGFRVNGDTTTFIEEGPITLAFCKDGTLISQSFEKEDSTKIKGKEYIFPDFITDDLGGWRMYKSGEDLKRKDPIKYREMSKALSRALINIDSNKIESQADAQKVAYERAKLETEEYFIDKINTFIPIRIKTGINYTKEDSLEQRWRPDVILWYEVSNEFLNTLPKELRKKIENEYSQLTKQPEKSENAISSNCEYFEVCRSTLKSATDVIVFPNPAIESTNMKFNLKTESSLRVNLFDISGRLVKELKSFSNFNTGQHQLPLDLNGITEGMYLIVLESEKGETNIQRLVKGKN